MTPAPSINGVRLATLNDLDRISIVAAAAFFWSPTFKFQRPRYREFPADTVASYRIEYENAIKDPTFVVLVAEDILEPDEAEHVDDALRFACSASCAGIKGIVGICSLKLKPGSCYAGHLQPAGKHVSAERCIIAKVLPGYDDLRCGQRSDHRKRDQCPEAVAVYESVTGPPKSLCVQQSPVIERTDPNVQTSRQQDATQYIGRVTNVLASRPCGKNPPRKMCSPSLSWRTLDHVLETVHSGPIQRRFILTRASMLFQSFACYVYL
jgi:hypothetical protein